MKLLTGWLFSSQEFFHNLGWLGMLAYAGAMGLAGLASVPLSPFAITAGLVFGFGKGLLTVQAGTVLSAALNFLVSRHVARGFVQRKLAGHPKFRAIDIAVGREGWKIVALMRFVPMPFGLMNYLFGLTAIPFWPYLVATAFPIILGNVLFVWSGATAAEAGLAAASGQAQAAHPLKIAMMVLGILAAFAATTYVARIARKAVAQRDETLADQ